MVYTTVEVDIDLEVFDDNTLLEEVDKRGLSLHQSQKLIQKIYDAKKSNQPIDSMLDELFWLTLGRL